MSPRRRAVVVEDEPDTLDQLVRLLEETGRIEVVATALGPEQALALSVWPEVDVAFLDIQMPVMNGIELARRLPGDPLVVFITGFDQYARQAFDLYAVDYVTKPVDPLRLMEALDRLEHRRGDPARSTQTVAEQIIGYLQGGTGPGATGRIERVAGRVVDGLQMIDIADVTHFVAQDRLVYAVTTGQSRYLVDQSMEQLERRLDPGRFQRIHRTCIVSLPHVHKLPRSFWREPVLWLKDGTELEVSRDRVRALRDRHGL